MDQRVPLDLALPVLRRDQRAVQSPPVVSGAAGFLHPIQHGLREL